MKMTILIIVCLLFTALMVVPMIKAEQTVKSIDIPLGYKALTNPNQIVMYNYTVDMPDGISKILSLEFYSTAEYLAGTKVYGGILIGNTTFLCNPFEWSIPTWNVDNYEVNFDCTSLIQSSGWKGNSNISLQFIFKADNYAGNVKPRIKMTYMNNPKGLLNIFGTEYEVGQDVKVWLQLLNSNGSYINNGVCYVDIYTPSNQQYIGRAIMNNMNHDGIYYYDLTTPQIQGVYPVIAECYYEAGQTYNYGTTYFLKNGTLDAGDLSRTVVLDGTYMTTDESSPSSGDPRRYWSEVNFSSGKICSNISEALLTGISVYWTGRWNSNLGNDVMSIWIFNYTSNSWLKLNNTITGVGTGSKTVTNSISLTNITKAGFVNSSGSNLRLKFNDTSLADTSSSGFDYDYLAVSCDQLASPTWQEIKGSSEIHVTSPNLYTVSYDTNAYLLNDSASLTLYNGSVKTYKYYTGIFTHTFSFESGTSVTEDAVLIEYQGMHSIPCNSILDFIFHNSSGYYPYNFTTQRQTEEDHCSINFYLNLEPLTNYEFIIHARNIWESDMRSTKAGVDAIYELLDSSCDVWKIIHGYPNYTIPLNSSLNGGEYNDYYRACASWHDNYYWFNQTYQQTLIDKPFTIDEQSYLTYESDYISTKFAQNKLQSLTNSLLINLQSIADYSLSIINNPVNTSTNLTEQQIWATFSTQYQNWLLLNMTPNMIWNYSNRSLTNFNFNVNVTANVNNTAIADEIWNYNGTISNNILSQFFNAFWDYTSIINSNILTQIADAIWTHTPNRNLTYYETMNVSLGNLSANSIADAVWNYNGNINNNIIHQLITPLECRLINYFAKEEGWGVDIPIC